MGIDGFIVFLLFACKSLSKILYSNLYQIEDQLVYLMQV